MLLLFDSVLNASYALEFSCSVNIAAYVERNRSYLYICINWEKNTRQVSSHLNESFLNMIPLGFGKYFVFPANLTGE